MKTNKSQRVVSIQTPRNHSARPKLSEDAFSVMTEPQTYHELTEGSWTKEQGNVSCSHSKSKEFSGVEARVDPRRALASKHCS